MGESQYQPRLSSTQGTATPNSMKKGFGNLSMLRSEGGKMKVRCGERISTSARLMKRFVTSDEGRKVQDRTWVSRFCLMVEFCKLKEYLQ